MEHGYLTPLLLMLLIAIGSIALFRRLGLPAILAYLLTGVVSGPSGFNWFSQAQMHSVAELGVVLLMFSLGLEFSLPRLWAMRRTVFGLGSAQVLVTSAISACIALYYDQSTASAIVIGAAIALSSTAIVLKLLNEQDWLRRRHGELSVSVLLFQDIAVVPLLILLPLLATDGEALALQDIFYGLLKGTVAFVGLMAAGKWLLPKLFDEIARARSSELFVLATLVVALSTGAFTQWMGMSMALGAFMAGMLLGESQYRRQLEADIRPFRDLLMGLFFISIGMLLDFQLVMAYWWQILLLLFAVIVGKGMVVYLLLRFSGEPIRNAATSAMTLAQVGEFSFVILALAVNYELLDKQVSTQLVMVAVVSMAIAPWLVRHSAEIGKRMQARVDNNLDDEPEFPVEVSKDLVIILGYGRVGQTIARFLKIEAIPYLVLDMDPARVTEARNGGEPVYYGDACKASILKQLGIRDAGMLVVTFCDSRALEEVVHMCRDMAPELNILVRTRDDKSLDQLEHAGATQVIPESLEGSLMLVSQVLYKCGIPLSRILKRLESERRNHYRYLHGFFSGVESDFTLEQLHAVSLPEGASVVGKRIGELPWEKLRVELRAVRRDGAEVEQPSKEWLLKTGDILLLQGKPRRVERAEQYLLQG
ncbi:monovalent cation:proton antiporter-2 (CPA2) family protein [Shewanella submarina]|uniref:Monovalent cation:proton antiporter-2 (CPA2) family protein n=1 Tax=Shewanella submarina TaxID=2016376 RepID=A0ABV7GLV3_9GAMM|nr:monovalent cation:proton antiporter-2 (CPA2) family protein [Shewanella submarina]MCL1036380.1 monovalent cation:proton antiporter-2 (CPA2) family protein [Shewanella submarina]